MILLDGQTERDFGLIPLQGHIHPINTGIQHKTIKIPGMAGVHDIRTELAPKYFEFEFAIKEQDETTMQAKLNEFVTFLCDGTGHPRDIELIFDYEPDKYYTVKLNNSIDPERIRGFSRFSVSFVASDPYAYAIEAKTVTTFPAVNSGTASCPALITATMPAAADFLRIEIAEANDYFLLDQELEQGDIVTIDTARRLTLVNDVDARAYVTAASTYPVLPSGEFSFTTEPADIPLIVEYRERWI